MIKIKSEQRLYDRCEILVETIIQLQPLYRNCETEIHRAYLETLVGAGIWYLGKV